MDSERIRVCAFEIRTSDAGRPTSEFTAQHRLPDSPVKHGRERSHSRPCSPARLTRAPSQAPGRAGFELRASAEKIASDALPRRLPLRASGRGECLFAKCHVDRPSEPLRFKQTANRGWAQSGAIATFVLIYPVQRRRRSQIQVQTPHAAKRNDARRRRRASLRPVRTTTWSFANEFDQRTVCGLCFSHYCDAV